MESVTSAPIGRRALSRARTLADIKTAARNLLTEQGPPGISLRAISRSLGMTAPALYRYYESLDALVVDLITDLYDELRQHMEASYEPLPPDHLVNRILTAARSFRSWAINHRPEFTLMFATFAPGSGMPPPGGCAAAAINLDAEPYAAMLRFSRTFGTMLNELYHRDDKERGFVLTPLPTPSLSPELASELRRGSSAAGIDVPDDVAFTFHSCWVKLYGLVAMEVFGQLAISNHAEELFEAELYAMLVTLGGRPDGDSTT